MKNVFSELPISGEIAGNVENLVAFFSVLVIFYYTVGYFEQLIWRSQQ